MYDTRGTAFPALPAAKSTFEVVRDAELSKPSTGQDWLRQGGDEAGRSVSGDNPGDTLDLKWTQHTGEQFNLNGSVIADGKLIVSSRAVDSPYSMMLAYDITSGREIWRTYLDGDAESAPTLHDGRVHLTTGVGRIYALDAEDGHVARESIDREEQHGDTVRRYGRAGGPVSVVPLAGGDRTVAVHQDWNTVRCRDARTGEKLPGGFGAAASWGQSHSTVVRELGSNTAYLHSSSSNTVIAMDLASCKQLWAKDTGGDIDSHSSPVLTQPASGPAKLVTFTAYGVRRTRPRPEDGRGDLGVQGGRRQHLRAGAGPAHQPGRVGRHCLCRGPRRCRTRL
ncbi:outer membrane protein assembly factor BamB family protein [Streptomyces sp. NBC_01210]|uniref:outer membrane protein assembly factor BamB family protein n=1 Tax=Streptomyces sp. NBC_01210 TaxID=2903774 RepID=UPI003FA3BC55